MTGFLRRPYNPDDFVDRGEITWITEAVSILAEGRQIGLRGFSLADESGMGKTWTLRHLAETVLQYNGSESTLTQPLTGNRLGKIPRVSSLYVDLLDWSSYFDGDGDPERTIKQLIIHMSRQIAHWSQTVPTGILGVNLETVSLADLRRWLEADVRRLTQESVFVLLLDQVHEAPWDLLDYLDLFLLGSLTAISCVLPVVAGRGQGYPWKSPEMQLHCESLKLKPFDESQTEQQLRKQVTDKAAQAREIHELSGGYPRLSYAIATLGEKKGLQAELDTVLEVVTEKAVRKQLTEYLGAICVLRSFDDDRMVAMMAAQGTTITRREASDVRKKLMRNSFVFWPDKGKGWVLDGSLRFTRERLLRLKDPDIFIGLHQAAYALYASWCDSYPKARETWKPEAEYHVQWTNGFESGTIPIP